MIFLAMIFFLTVVWLLPWWGIWLASVVLGVLLPGGGRRTLQVAIGATLVAVAAAYIQDGRNSGLISQRMSAMFGIPFSGGIFLIVALIAAVSATTGFRLGTAFSEARGIRR